MTQRTNSVIALIVACGTLAGCHSPKGGWLPGDKSSTTYWSTETAPKSVTMIDLRTNEEVFSIDIPAGQQLTFDFVPGAGDDPVYRPDLMRYAVWELGTDTGKLRNSLTVPAAWSRRIEVTIRTGIEYMPEDSTRELRSDEMADRPDWWTPDGGELPGSRNPVTIYDGSQVRP